MKFEISNSKMIKMWKELKDNDETHLFQCYLGLGHCLDITFCNLNNEYKLYSRDSCNEILSMTSENYMELHDYLVKTYVDIYKNGK